MSYQAGIILGGQAPDILNALASSDQAAQQRLDFDNQNAMRGMLQQNGAGIMAGDQNALNALAQFDPQAALGIQATRQDMTMQAEEFELRKAEARRMTEEAMRANADKLTKEQLAAEKAEMERALAGAATFYQKGDKAGYEAWLGQLGVDPAQFPFEQFPAHAATFEGVLEVMDKFAPPAPEDRYKVAGGSVIDLYGENGPQAVAQGAMQETTVFGPDGKPIMVQGAPGASAKFTEAQSKDNVYATRAEGAYAALEPVADALASYTDAAKEAVPFNLARPLQNSDYQLARQAGLEFLAVILRKDTGAAVTASEEDMYGRMFLPQPGDNPAVLEQKRVARGRAVEAIKAGMNPAQIAAMAQALTATEARTGADQPTPDDATKPEAKPKRLKFNPETGELE